MCFQKEIKWNAVMSVKLKVQINQNDTQSLHFVTVKDTSEQMETHKPGGIPQAVSAWWNPVPLYLLLFQMCSVLLCSGSILLGGGLQTSSQLLFYSAALSLL